MRVTVDLDNCTEFVGLKTYFNMWQLFNQIPDMRISESGKGYHILVRGIPISLETCCELRRLFGDDLIRIYYDSLDLFKPKNVLFKPAQRYGQSQPPFLRHEDTMIQSLRLRRRSKWMKKYGRR